MNDQQKALKEASEVLGDGKNEISEKKQINYDKTTKQFSIKIPKSLALKAGLTEKSILNIVYNPKEKETKEKIDKSEFVIYLKEGDDGKGKENT